MSRPTVLNAFRPYVPVEPEAPDARHFQVENPHGIDVPGCLGIHEVRLNGHVIPEYVDHQVPTDATLKHHETIRIPSYQLSEGPNGPILLRSLNSNDGNWQKGATVTVRGNWAEGDSADGFESKTTADLKKLVAEKGVDPKGMNRVALLAEVRK